MLSIEQISARVENLRERAQDRDSRQQDVLAVRRGQISSVYPDFFPEGIDANVVANFIDIVARDLSEVMAPLPAVNCSAANQSSDRSRKFADARTRIANNYFSHSDLQVQMYTGADMYITFGFVPFIIELDDEAGLPRIRIENPVGAYPEFDRYGRCIAFAKRYYMAVGELASQFPEYSHILLGKEMYKSDMNSQIEIVRYYDSEQSLLYVPERNNLVLSQARNPIGKMMVVVARRPSIDGEMRGQFDDVLGIQLLRNRFALLAMEAAEKSVQSPIVLPADVNELRTGTRYPEGRTGNIDASIITGQGVQALMGGFDTQVKSAQAIFASTLRDVISVCFEVDEKFFDYEKTIRGVDAGSPYQITYKPSKDIKKDYSSDVRYGMLAGLNPAQGLIFMLQALSGGLISTDLAMRELPFGINVTQEQEKIEVENMRKSLVQSLQAYTQAIPQMAMSGADPTGVIKKIADVIKARQRGVTIEDAVEDVFAPELPPAGAPEVEQPSPAPTAPVGGASPMAPTAGGGLQSILSALTAGGQASGSARTVSRR